MRVPKYLSPTSFLLYKNDPEEFYRRYISDRQFPRDPQTMPMAIGAAFDFLIKRYLINNLGSRMSSKQTEFALSIEKHNLPEAMEHGKRVFDVYSKSGALASLMLEVVRDAQFEFNITGHIKCDLTAPALSVPLNGRPDACFFAQNNMMVILDWKVNGWLAKSMKTPNPGFVQLHLSDGSLKGAHRDAMTMVNNGILVNACREAALHDDWSVQLCVYSWILGNPVGTPFVGAIDQVCGGGASGTARVAKHRFVVGKEFQLTLYKELIELWLKCTKQLPLFGNTLEESDNRCKALDSAIISFGNDDVFPAETPEFLRER